MSEGTPAVKNAYGVLSDRFSNYMKLAAARTVLFWDSQAYLPPDGTWARGEQLTAIAGAMRELIVRADAEELFATAASERESLTEAERANLAEMKRTWLSSVAVPMDLTLEKQRVSNATLAVWRTAKAENDFQSFAKSFKQLVPLIRQVAEAKGEAFGLDPYEALREEFDPGLPGSTTHAVLQELEEQLPQLLAQVIERQKSWPKPVPFNGDFSAERQRELSYKLLGMVLNEPRKSRIDTVPHPFTLTLSPGDVRITTRYEVDNIRFAIMIAMHESGHALYESGLPRELAYSLVGVARGGTAHESQSLMVEMQAGRTREFLTWLTPRLAEAFGGSDCWTVANVLNTYRRVGEGFIRVEADEISYPLHMILRYRLERALLAGDLAVDDLPQAWSDLSQKLFGRRPPDHAHGCLQDFHWTAGYFGYFPCYALGAALAAQYFERAIADDPAIRDGVAQGDFSRYRAWVRPRIHERASLVSFDEIVRDATAQPFSAGALKRHLRRRYLEEPLA
jgi:carboxypeptidase Taq